MTNNTKKRKHESSQPSAADHHDGHDGKMFDDENIESVLFEEMTTVNSQLISLANKVKLVDSRYFVYNSEIIDEFVGNIYEFLKQVDIHRKKVSSTRLNSDNLFSIFQFLNVNDLAYCRYVSKLWKDVVDRVEIQVNASKNVEFLVKSPQIKNVTSLKLSGALVSSFQSLSRKGIRWDKLHTLDISGNNLILSSVKHLTKCQMPNLTELSLRQLQKFKKTEADALFGSAFMSTVKKLDVSYNFDGIGSCLGTKYLKQITHLTSHTYGYRGNEFQNEVLKNKPNLEYLDIGNYQITDISLSNGNCKNLTYLKITECSINNQDFANLLISPNLPNLTTVKWVNANVQSYRNMVFDNTIAKFPPNSQSSITNLKLDDSNLAPFPSLIDHCPELKQLRLRPTKESQNVLSNYLNSTCLSNLEYLSIDGGNKELQIICTNPILSNLKELRFTNIEETSIDATILSNCTNLINLTKLEGNRKGKMKVTSECLQALKTNPTFSKLQTKDIYVQEETLKLENIR
ncbi:hypothetical protein NAEGRDRAFT_53913 [Naegleria gruberi]|uniref:F-box domain-containing protein n=1 Tax=Naegleria gruberi TaxID=5762 RepID=D2W192_NAEGR|nr:uncharacterized protein NAEGRDRAFT_53913 [Naegleria gruberi]EFC37187.1 hypothetical protein NAEGRDRAFT_53913 [Naegleria gruberi]|eukprot:XP_002669931.1 hypothetical protein NAEGRDRAFT_53913 [Naegleria gruberi strain NEG-M]